LLDRRPLAIATASLASFTALSAFMTARAFALNVHFLSWSIAFGAFGVVIVCVDVSGTSTVRAFAPNLPFLGVPDAAHGVGADMIW